MDGGVGDVVREAITKVGLITIRNIFDSGFRHTSSTRQVNTVEDLNEFKIRVPVTALCTSLFTGLGHRLRASAYNELYSPLQTRVVEGQEKPLALIGTSKLFKVQKYCTLSNHCWSGFWIVANSRAMIGLPTPPREILNTNLDAAAIKKRSDLIDMDRSLQAELPNNGMVFDKPDPDPTPFRVALQKAGFYAQQQKKYGSEPWTRLEQYTGSLI